jgi:hypothetical protein
MKNTLIKTLAAISVALGVSSMAMANPIPITGSIAFTGGTDFNNVNYLLSTAVSFNNVYVLPFESFGSFAGLNIGDSVQFSTITFSPATVPTPDLWSFTDLNTHETYTFDASSITATATGASSWKFNGLGYFTITGGATHYRTTQGSWILTFNQSGASIAFSSTGVVGGVPDSGTTALLVALGLLGMGGYALRNRLAKA